MALTEFLAMHSTGVAFALVIAAAGVVFYIAFRD